MQKGLIGLVVILGGPTARQLGNLFPGPVLSIQEARPGSQCKIRMWPHGVEAATWKGISFPGGWGLRKRS